MLEITLGTVRPADKIDLKVSTSKLLVKANYPKITGTTAHAAWISAASDARLTSTRYTQDKGNKQQFENMTLLDLAEIAACNEGYIQIEGTDAATSATAVFSIELSNSGAVSLNSRDYFTIQFSGFGAFDTAEFYSLGAPVEFDEHLKYSAVACNNGAQVRFSCVSSYAIAVKPDDVVKLTLNYSNGITQEITGQELLLSAPDTNETMYVVNGLTMPTASWVLFPLPSCDRGILTLSNDGFAYLLSNKNYEA